MRGGENEGVKEGGRKRKRGGWVSNGEHARGGGGGREGETQTHRESGLVLLPW